MQSRLRDEAIQERIEQERPAFERQWGEVVLRARTIPPEQISYNEMYGIMYVNGRPMLQAREHVEPEPQSERESRLSFSWPKALGRKVRGVGMPFGISLTVRKKENEDAARQSEQQPEEKPTPVEVAPELLPRYRIGLFRQDADTSMALRPVPLRAVRGDGATGVWAAGQALGALVRAGH